MESEFFVSAIFSQADCLYGYGNIPTNHLGQIFVSFSPHVSSQNRSFSMNGGNAVYGVSVKTFPEHY